MELTELQKRVIEQLGYEDLEGAKEDLKGVLEYGADSGFSGFIYYTDTIEFFDRNRDSILELAQDLAEDLGEDMLGMVCNFGCLRHDELKPTNIMRAIYEEEDENERCVKNALSWFALEEVARQLEEELEEV